MFVNKKKCGDEFCSVRHCHTKRKIIIEFHKMSKVKVEVLPEIGFQLFIYKKILNAKRLKHSKRKRFPSALTFNYALLGLKTFFLSFAPTNFNYTFSNVPFVEYGNGTTTFHGNTFLLPNWLATRQQSTA